VVGEEPTDNDPRTIDVKIPSGETVPEASVPNRVLSGNKIFVFKEWQRNGVKYDPDTAEPFTTDETITAAWTKLATVSANINLRDSIDLNFSVWNLGDEVENYTVWYTGIEEAVALSTFEKVNERYFINVAQCAARRMADQYSFKLFHNNELIFDNQAGEVKIDSIKAYCDYEIEQDGSASPELKNLCEAVLDFGSAAQQAIDGTPDNDPTLVNGGTYKFDTTAAISGFQSSSVVITGEKPYKSVSTALDLVHKTGIRFTFTFKDNNPEPTITIKKNGTALTPDTDYEWKKVSANKYNLNIKNIKALDLSGEFSIEITTARGTVDYKYSALAYACKWQDRVEDHTGILSKAIYHYWDMAVNYI
jgi:hypothetical protein